MKIAILGGGITGLSAAWHLARRLPEAKIQLHEADHRLGGWMRSLRAGEAGGALIENGPRTLRHQGTSGLATLELVKGLHLEDELLIIPKTHPSHKNRFIVYQNSLVRVPTEPISFLKAVITREPILSGIPSNVLLEPFRQKLEGKTDESIYDFISRRLGSPLADNLFSALVRGIYAGDPRKLGIRATFKRLWDMEQTSRSLIRCLLKGGLKNSEHETKLQAELHSTVGLDLVSRLNSASFYSFKNGMETLPQALTYELSKMGNVEICYGSCLKTIQPMEDGVQISTSKVDFHVDRVISTLQGKILGASIPKTFKLPHMESCPAVSVGVVSLVWPSEIFLPVQGFGYLIPSSAINPDNVLGVVFDMKGQDTQSFTKLTVMIGGYMWDGRSKLPDNYELLNIAKLEISKRLNIRQAPSFAKATIQHDCIPQYLVGHFDRMRILHDAINSSMWKGKLSVGGAAFTGVSVNDCIKIGRQIAISIALRENPTGLEQFLEPINVP